MKRDMEKAIKKAIKKAVEGGYNLPHVQEPSEREAAIRFYTHGTEWTKLTYDPEFWRCLGKAEGWTGITEENTEAEKTITYGEFMRNYWETYWHRFIDHLIKGKDADSFFNELLK